MHKVDPASGVVTLIDSFTSGYLTFGTYSTNEVQTITEPGEYYWEFQIINDGGSISLTTVALRTSGAKYYDRFSGPGWGTDQLKLRKVRAVGCSVLVTNINADLTNGGQIAICQIPGSTTEQYANIIPQSFDQIAELPDAYNGPLKTGCYGWIRPEDTFWGVFKPLMFETSMDYGQFPSLQGVVVYQSQADTTPQKMRIQCDLICEATTKDQFLGPKLSIVDQDAMEQAQAYLAGVKNVGANDSHEGLIAKVMSTIQKVNSSVQPWLPMAKKAAVFAAKFAPLLL